MAHLDNNSWGSSAGVEAPYDYGVQVKPMGLKVQYTFDKGCQERCLARWPQILHVRTIPMDEQNSIGVVDLRTCLQAVAQCSPELIGDNEKDYTVYAFDYSEPDTPLVGQGMLSWGVNQGPIPSDVPPQLVTGRITKNFLAVFGNGVRETLEVRLKLTAVPKIVRNHSVPPPTASGEQATIARTSTRTSTPTPSENSEWTSLRQSNPNLAQAGGIPINPPTVAPAPNRPFNPNCEPRGNTPVSNYQVLQPMIESRPASAEPNVRESYGPVPVQGPGVSERQNVVAEELPIAPAPAKGAKSQSRPASRASSRPPSGRPRGRPRKKPLPAEGSTSGYEDGTDADDGPPRTKKRATMTRVERSNTATFGSAPESLRVAASTAGSIRNFRPIAAAGDTPVGNHIQELPRAPTPVPGPRLSGLLHVRPIGSSGLGRESTSSPGMNHSFASTYSELSQSASHSQDARSPAEYAGPSPSQIYSDEATPPDIGSSPPVPRSALYSIRSSPAPSSPILPPMPMTMPQPDSGYMSGGLEDSRMGEEVNDKAPIDTAHKAPTVAKPKPRRSRAKKQPAKGSTDLIIHAETPGPPELLPQTSLYNPPHLSRKNSEVIKTPAAPEPPHLPTFHREQSERAEPEAINKKPLEKEASPEEVAREGASVSLEVTLMNALADEHNGQHLVSTHTDNSVGGTMGDSQKYDDAQPVTETPNSQAELPAASQPNRDTPMEQELPTVPASDPVLHQLTFPRHSEPPAHPQTDAAGPADGKSNKNFVKRQTIRQKLEEAVAQGQLPSFCRNCGALQTPTWRKIWKQERKGAPAYHEYSEKPGHVTAINILERDNEGNPTSYEVLKKSLGPTDSKSTWIEVLLCNPCGIWFSKFKQHRPAEKWEKDEQRLSQTRKKRANGAGLPRPKKARTKSDAQTNPTSEACLPTDPIGPPSPKNSILGPHTQMQQQGHAAEKNAGKGGRRDLETNGQGSTHSRASVRSRGSGTPGSPIAVDDDLGGTRRLLFPSPRKDGEQKVLGEAAVNIVQMSSEYLNVRGAHDPEKENNGLTADGDASLGDDFVDIFGTPPRPSTPPPKMSSSSGPFKTPTRPTPSHRPVTRSVTRSMRSGRSVNSPSQILMLERTPTRTPRSSAAKRQSLSDLLPSHLLDSQVFDSPLSRSISSLLPDMESFTMPSPPSFQLDLSSLPPMDSEELSHGALDFNALLGADIALQSSPSSGRNGSQKTGFSHRIVYNRHTDQWIEANSDETH